MRLVLAALAVVAFVSVPVPAHAALTQPSGPPCGAVSLSYEEDLVVDAGPVSLVDEDTGLPHTGTVTCTLRMGLDHTGAVIASATSDPGTGAVVLPATQLDTGPLPWAYEYSLCTRLDTDAGTLYWYEPQDRNVDGYWSTSTAVRCDDLWETSDLRLTDFPFGPALSLAQTVLGETDPAVGAANATTCGTEAVRDVVTGLYACDAPSPTGALSIARVPGAAVLRTAAPFGWACTDVHSGLPVTAGSLLVTPDPGVTCVPLPGSAPVRCGWLEMVAHLAPTTTGRVTMTEACGDLVLRRVLVPLQGRVAETYTGMYGAGGPPLRCGAEEDTLLEPTYVLSCYRLFLGT